MTEAAPLASIRVLVVGDLMLGREGMASLLDREETVDVLIPTASVEELPARLAADNPDVVVLYLVPGVRAAAQLERVATMLRDVSERIRLVVVSPTGDGLARALLRSGPDVVAFLVDGRVGDAGVLVRAVLDVMAGVVSLDPGVVEALVGRRGYPGLQDLTPREFDVLAEMAAGMSNPTIADHLEISVKAVEANVSAIFRKLDLPPDSGRDRRLSAALIYLKERF